MKFLNGRELASYIKEKQAKQFRSLWTEFHIKPKLAVIMTNVNNPVIDLYVKLKKQYGQDVGVEVEIFKINMSALEETIQQLNVNPVVNGIIVQLPLAEMSQVDYYLNLLDVQKDVDGLSQNHIFDPATPKAILWLLAGFNIDLTNKKILLVGQGRLVGGPLLKMLKSSGLEINVADETTTDLKKLCLNSDVIITATGQSGLITGDMLKSDTVIVDAGTTSENGQIVGDLDSKVYERNDLILTPLKGGVGPLTICALFDNLYQAISNNLKS